VEGRILRVEEILNVLPESLQEKFLAKLEKISEKYGVEVKEGWIEVKERIFCGKYSRCQKCASGQGHVGPFYYFHFRVNGKLRTAYLGKPKEGNSKPLRKTETWKDWLDMSPEQLRSHLQTLSAEQIRSIAKSILSPEQLRKGKNKLIETIIFTLKEFKAHMKIGPPAEDNASLCEECEWFEDNRCSWQENAAIFTCHFQPKKKDNCSQIPGLKPSKIKVTPQEAIVNSLILEARKKMTRGQIYHKHKD